MKTVIAHFYTSDILNYLLDKCFCKTNYTSSPEPWVWSTDELGRESNFSLTLSEIISKKMPPCSLMQGSGTRKGLFSSSVMYIPQQNRLCVFTLTSALNTWWYGRQNILGLNLLFCGTILLQRAFLSSDFCSLKTWCLLFLKASHINYRS